jgi:hypothetical protein
LGRGSYGVVYDAEGTYKSNKYKFAIKEIRNVSYSDINNEYNYSVSMSNMHLGPKVFDAFYVPSGNKFTQYIFMEKYHDTVHKLLVFPGISTFDKKILINKMLMLLYTKIFKSNVICYDIKPNNYVFKVSKGEIDVRLIDFGQEFCEPNELPNNRRIVILLLLMVQLAYILKKYIPGISKALGIFDESSTLFKNRMKYVRWCSIELSKNKKLYDNYKHYIHPNKNFNLYQDFANVLRG